MKLESLAQVVSLSEEEAFEAAKHEAPKSFAIPPGQCADRPDKETLHLKNPVVD